MLKPVQRLPQYKLLLEDYLRHLAHDSADFDDTTAALKIVSDAAEHANNTIRQGVSEQHTIPQCGNFSISATPILREIKSLSSKTTFFTCLATLNFDSNAFLHLLRPEISKKSKSKVSKIPKINFTENLSGRKFLNFPHCVLIRERAAVRSF